MPPPQNDKGGGIFSAVGYTTKEHLGLAVIFRSA